MNIKQAFRSHPIWVDVPATEIQILLDAAEEIHFEPQTSLTRQYHPSTYLYFMYSGSLRFYMQLNESGEQLLVGKSDRQWTAIGWAGLRIPYRYTITTQCEQECTVLRWERPSLQAVFQRYPRLGCCFLGLVMRTGVDILAQSRYLLVSAAKQFAPSWQPVKARDVNRIKLDPHRILPWLRHSVFFEGFDEEALIHLAGKAMILAYQGGEQLTPPEETDGLYILVNGVVSLYFSPTMDADNAVAGAVFIRTLDNAGQIVAWSSVLAPKDRGLTAVMSQDTLLCFIARDVLDAYVQQRPDFGLTLISRLLFLIGNQLRSTRAQLIHQQFEDECFSVRSVLQQAAPQLSVSSLLHNVPHLLTSRLTQNDAFHCLEKVKNHGNGLEKNLAGICLDLLAETRRECKFYKGLLKVYETVVSAPPNAAPEKVRQACDTEISNTLQHASYVIHGIENLPDEPGHIFILNHLVNHPYNALPNHFELAMDTHFISAMVLRPKYGDGGVRVVRRPRNEEFGHQDYYNRLGYIYVVTKESGQNPGIPSLKGNQLETFVSAARKTLSAKNNLVICPEGTSLWSEESPGPFKPGAFVLAGTLDPEPLIVPIAVANFDKHLRNTLAVLIKPPFRISEYVNVRQRDDLTTFLQDYRVTYREYVREAQQLADSAVNPRSQG